MPRSEGTSAVSSNPGDSGRHQEFATVFAGQANIAHGPQQVNNLSQSARDDNPGPIEVLEAELLEGYGERMDTEAPRAAVAGNLDLAPMGTRNRSEDT